MVGLRRRVLHVTATTCVLCEGEYVYAIQSAQKINSLVCNHLAQNPQPRTKFVNHIARNSSGSFKTVFRFFLVSERPQDFPRPMNHQQTGNFER